MPYMEIFIEMFLPSVAVDGLVRERFDVVAEVLFEDF